MERDQFYETVERRGSLSDRADATDATRVVLSTTAERVDEEATLRAELESLDCGSLVDAPDEN